MLKVLKNEFIKMFGGKKFYILSIILILSIIIMAVMMKTMNSGQFVSKNFVSETFSGMVMKPFLPVFMVLIAADIITEDYANGTMKFSLMTPIKRSDLILGKLIFIALYALILMAISFIGSYIVGFISSESLGSIPYNLKFYAITFLPVMSFSVVICFISLFINSSGAMIGLGIGIDFIMIFIGMISDKINYFTFSGGMYSYEFIGKSGPYSIYLFPITACFYIVLFTALMLFVVSKKDFVR